MSVNATFETLRAQLAQPDTVAGLANVYVLHGEEGFYIDELVKAFENVMPEADREFNQYVIYATRVTPDGMHILSNPQ